MKNLFFSLLFFVFMDFFGATASNAQPTITLSKTLGGAGVEQIRDMIADEQGNLIAVCNIDSVDRDTSCHFHGESDVWLVKMDPDGNILWQHCYGGSNVDDPYQIIQTMDGGFLFVAVSWSDDGDVAFNHGGTDLWMVKTDSLGNMQWQNSIGSSSSDSPYDLNQIKDGSYLLAAYSLGNDGDFPSHYGGLNDDAWLVFISELGEVDTAVHYGGSNHDYITEVLELENGDLQLFGATYSTDYDLEGTSAYGLMDAWMIRTDSIGAIKWQQKWGGNFSDYIIGAVQLPNGEFLTAGSSASNNGEYSSNHGGVDVWVMRLDSTGNVLINKLLGGAGNDVTTGRMRLIPAGNGLFTIGARTLSPDGDVGFNYGYEDFWFLSVNTNGILVSSKVSGGSQSDNLFTNSISPSQIAIEGGLTTSDDFDIVGFKGGGDGWFILIEGFTLIGTTEQQGSQIIIYPNPLHESFNISAEDKSILRNAVLEIYSLNGTLLMKKKIRENDERIIVHGLPAGTYQCIISDRDNKKVASAKLIVQ